MIQSHPSIHHQPIKNITQRGWVNHGIGMIDYELKTNLAIYFLITKVLGASLNRLYRSDPNIESLSADHLQINHSH